MSRLVFKCDPIEVGIEEQLRNGEIPDGWRKFRPGPTHYYIDDVEVSEGEARLFSAKHGMGAFPCTGDAVWDHDQAVYVAKQLPAEQGGKWFAYPCDGHWHVMEDSEDA